MVLVAHRGGYPESIECPKRGHYWSIRQCDLRDLQSRLAAYGLSSLGRSEPHVEATLLLVRAAIYAMLGDIWQQPPLAGASVDNGPELLHQRTEQFSARSRSIA